jgi:hypothetical protein
LLTQATQADDLGKLPNSFRGLVFFGTPHGRCTVPGKTGVHILQKIAKAFTEIRPKIEQALEAGSDDLVDLADEFRKLSLIVENKFDRHQFLRASMAWRLLYFS